MSAGSVAAGGWVARLKIFCGVRLLVAVRKHLRLGVATAALRGKAVEGHRSPSRWRVHGVARRSRSVLECASPLAFWEGDAAVDLILVGRWCSVAQGGRWHCHGGAAAPPYRFSVDEFVGMVSQDSLERQVQLGLPVRLAPRNPGLRDGIPLGFRERSAKKSNQEGTNFEAAASS